MKKFVALAMASVLTVGTLTSCGSDEGTTGSETGDTGSAETSETLLKVAMTTDSGTIDDKSFNQGTWEGIELYREENGTIETKYIKPEGQAEADYLNAFADLIDAGYEVIFSPGFKFETAVYKAQDQYPDVKFVILDGAPNNGDGTAVINENSESIVFAEHESGFYAGVVAALTSKTGKVGFVGGMEIPAVQKFGYGYVAGVAYANEKFGTTTEVTQYKYQGSFDDVTGGQQVAGSFYDSGCDIVFHAAGGVGVGVINEGKARRAAGDDVWVIGVDVDQYNEGLMDDNTSVILTSAMKDLGSAAYSTIDDIINGDFKGGQVVTFDSKNNGVGLPKENPNLSEDVITKYDEVYAQVAGGEITVPTTVEELETFIADHGYTTPSGVKYSN